MTSPQRMTSPQSGSAARTASVDMVLDGPSLLLGSLRRVAEELRQLARWYTVVYGGIRLLASRWRPGVRQGKVWTDGGCRDC